MIGTADIIANGFRRIGTQEYRAGMFDLFRIGARLRDTELQMLRRDTVAQLCGLVEVLNRDDRAKIAPARPGDRAPLQGGEPRQTQHPR